MIDIKNLSVTYEGSSKHAIHDITLSIKPGEIGLLLGGNSSGKSTLLHCLSGVIPRIQKASLCGSCNVNEHKGVLLQDSDLYLMPTVQEELEFCLLNYGFSSDEIDKTRENMGKKLWITNLMSRAMQTLSGGERQKVALGAALISSPPVLLLDEPLTQLDPDFVEYFLEYLQELSQKEVCILIASTSAHPFRKLSFKYFILEDGMLAEEGSRDKLLKKQQVTKYQNIFDSWFGLRNLKNPGSQKQFTDNSPPVLSMKSISYSYGEFFLLQDINLQVYPGEILAIVGPNGSGKTTMLKLAAGILQPEKGDIQVLGKSLKGLSIAQATEKTGFLFQNPDHQICQNTLEKEIAWGLKARGYDASYAAKKAQHWLKRLGMEHLAIEHPYSLSKTLRQWVALASIMAQEPALLLLDEPTSRFDTLAAAQFLEFIINMVNSGMALVLVTHQKELGEHFAHRVITLNEGRISFVGNGEGKGESRVEPKSQGDALFNLP